MEDEYEEDYFDNLPDFGILGQYRPSGYIYYVYYQNKESYGVEDFKDHSKAVEFANNFTSENNGCARLQTVQVLKHDSLPTEHLVMAVEDFGNVPSN